MFNENLATCFRTLKEVASEMQLPWFSGCHCHVYDIVKYFCSQFFYPLNKRPRTRLRRPIIKLGLSIEVSVKQRSSVCLPVCLIFFSGGDTVIIFN